MSKAANKEDKFPQRERLNFYDIDRILTGLIGEMVTVDRINYLQERENMLTGGRLDHVDYHDQKYWFTHFNVVFLASDVVSIDINLAGKEYTVLISDEFTWTNGVRSCPCGLEFNAKGKCDECD